MNTLAYVLSTLKEPSFTVNEARGFFIALVAELTAMLLALMYRESHFSESVERLAGEAGLMLPQVL